MRKSRLGLAVLMGTVLIALAACSSAPSASTLTTSTTLANSALTIPSAVRVTCSSGGPACSMSPTVYEGVRCSFLPWPGGPVVQPQLVQPSPTQGWVELLWEQESSL